MTGTDYCAAATQLGLELQRLRKTGGQTLRELAERAGLSAHSNLVDYEKGRRVPPRDILRVYEQIGQVPQGSLDSLHGKAASEFAERTRGTFRTRQPTELPVPPEPAEPSSGAGDDPEPSEPDSHRGRRLRNSTLISLIAGVTLVLAGGGTALGVRYGGGPMHRPTPAPTRRFYRQGEIRGPVDIAAACNTQWGARFSARLLDVHNAYTWRCVAPGEAVAASSGVELKVQCLRQYGGNTTAVALQSSQPQSWRCVQVTSGT